MSLSTKLTQTAKDDIRTILRWLEDRSSSGADAWYREWSDTLARLADENAVRLTAPENADHDDTIYQVLFKTRRGRSYRAIYIIRDDELFVLRVRGPGQDLVGVDEMPQPNE